MDILITKHHGLEAGGGSSSLCKPTCCMGMELLPPCTPDLMALHLCSQANRCGSLAASTYPYINPLQYPTGGVAVQPVLVQPVTTGVVQPTQLLAQATPVPGTVPVGTVPAVVPTTVGGVFWGSTALALDDS